MFFVPKHKEKSSSMVILNCDGLSQFYFGGLLVLVRKFGNNDNTILYYAHVNTLRWESRTITNSVVLLMCKRKNELSDNYFNLVQLATAYLPMRSIDAVINVMYLSNSLLLTSIFRFLPFYLHLPLCFCPNNKIYALCLCSIKKARGSLLSVPFLAL